MSALGVGLFGLGTVGAAVARQLLDHGDVLSSRAGHRLELRAVVVRDAARAAQRLGCGELVRDDPAAVLESPDIDIVVELVGGIDPAHEWIATALDRGRFVVTANKALIAEHGAELLQRAYGRLRFEAAVGAGIPLVAVVADSLAGDRITRIDAVLNGTTNVILEAMMAGGSYADALADAQRRGFAEADPALDVDGSDAAAKLAILASLAGGAWVHPASVLRTGVESVSPRQLRTARLAGHAVRLLASARCAGSAWTLRVEPTALPTFAARRQTAEAGRWTPHQLAYLPGATNGAVIGADLAGPLVVRGAGAGGSATASAVLSDVIALARGRAGPDAPESPAVIDDTDAEVAALVGFEALHSTGIEDTVETVRLLLGDRGITTLAICVDPDAADGRVGAALLTDPARRGTIEAAIDTLDADPRFEDAVSWLPVAQSW